VSNEGSRPVKSNSTRGLLTILLFAGIGAAFGYTASRWLIDNRSDLLQLESPVILLLAILPILFFVILVHELGYVFGGWLSGHRFYMLIVGPLCVRRDLGEPRIEFNRKLDLMGGQALCLPTKLDRFAWRRFWLVVMGPAASGLLAVTCWMAAGSLGDSNSVLTDILMVTSLLSALG
jgi:hypothetical protein